MTTSASTLLRVSALVLAAGLGLSACSSDETTTPTPSDSPDLEMPEAPEATEQELSLAETLEADFDVSRTLTMEEQWPDITAMASALRGTEDPDLCQQAGAEQYGMLVDAQPASVRATIDTAAVLDEHASSETVFVYYATEGASPQQVQAAHEHTDVSCVEEYETAIEHDTTTTDVADQQATLHTWEVVASDQLTGRMIDIVSEDIFVRYVASYPPQIMAEDLTDDAAEAFNEAATERAVAVFEAAAQ